MKSKISVIRELIKERNDLQIKMLKIRNFKFNKTKEFLSLGSQMCQMIDTQYFIMNSYYEILTLRIMKLREEE